MASPKMRSGPLSAYLAPASAQRDASRGKCRAVLARALDEDEFWARLEYRVCVELRRSQDQEIRYLWCDGFLPE